MNLIILERGELGDEGDVRLAGVRAAHLVNILKVAPGDEVRIGMLDGPRGVGAVRSIEDGAVVLRCAFEEVAPSRPRVDVLLALPRPKVMRRLWAQLAALGVGQIILTNAERVERNYFDTHVLTPACYRPLLIEGLQQARDTRLPAVSIYRQFRALVEDKLDALFTRGLRVAADPDASRAVSAVVGESAEERMLLAIGPEGGWNDFERSLLTSRGFQLAGMGARALRTDTACVALLALATDSFATSSRRICV